MSSRGTAVRSAAALLAAEAVAEGRSSLISAEEYPLARLSERLDRKICPLCRQVHGKILRTDSPEYRQWRLPSHVNCRRTLSFLHRTETDAKPTWKTPDPELIRRHGHYHLRPRKYARLRQPADVAGRHFIVRRVRHLATGRMRTVLDWAPWWDGIPAYKRQFVLRARGAETEAEFLAALVRLKITDLSDPAQVLQVIRYGLADRLDGWVDEAKKKQQRRLPRLRLPAARKVDVEKLDPSLQTLKGEALALWAREDARKKIFAELDRLLPPVVRDDSDISLAARALIRRIDRSVEAGMAAVGLPRAPVRSVAVRSVNANGQKSPDCDLTIGRAWLARSVADDRPDSVWRTWVHESLHARAKFDMRHGIYAHSPGFEEGPVEGFARLITRELAGMEPDTPAYGSYVAACVTLAGRLDVTPDRLYRHLLKNNFDDLERNFVGAVASLMAEEGRPIEDATLAKLRAVAAEVFSVFNHAAETDFDRADAQWRRVFGP